MNNQENITSAQRTQNPSYISVAASLAAKINCCNSNDTTRNNIVSNSDIITPNALDPFKKSESDLSVIVEKPPEEIT